MGGYRTRCLGRRGKKREQSCKLAQYIAFMKGYHGRWSDDAQRAYGSLYPTRRQRRTWTPNGEKARANRRRDADIRASVAFLEKGGYGVPWWMLSQGYEAPSCLVAVHGDEWRQRATPEQLAAEKAYLESLP